MRKCNFNYFEIYLCPLFLPILRHHSLYIYLQFVIVLPYPRSEVSNSLAFQLSPVKL